MRHYLAEARKALAAVAGFAATAVASGVLPPRQASWAVVIIALATAAGVYSVPNAVRSDRDAEGGV